MKALAAFIFWSVALPLLVVVFVLWRIEDDWRMRV